MVTVVGLACDCVSHAAIFAADYLYRDDSVYRSTSQHFHSFFPVVWL